jgi:hypothetical protein
MKIILAEIAWKCGFSNYFSSISKTSNPLQKQALFFKPIDFARVLL